MLPSQKVDSNGLEITKLLKVKILKLFRYKPFHVGHTTIYWICLSVISDYSGLFHNNWVVKTGFRLDLKRTKQESILRNFILKIQGNCMIGYLKIK